VVYADANGDFIFAGGGGGPVTVESRVEGLWFNVDNIAGADTVLSLNVTPPGPADFVHNADNSSELVRAEVNAYVESNVIRDFVLTYNPAYPVINNQMGMDVNVNLDSNCNAFYSNGEQSINFYTSGGGCPNTANSTIVHHEYGHHLVATGGSGQGAYGEGMGDVVGVLITDDPNLALGFFGNCNVPLRNADNNCQYQEVGCSSCGSAIHDCGQLISGCVWSTRNELLATNPFTYLDIISNLAVNSILLHNGSSITPSITIDYLTLDDDDGDIFNGTPHYAEINAGFSAHNMPAPELALLSFSFPQGLADVISPQGGTTVPVVVEAVTAEPQPGPGVLHVDTGPGFVALPMMQAEPNHYDAVFPSADCGTQVAYYFSAETTTGQEVVSPPGAPANSYMVLSATSLDVMFLDDFESDLGWTVTNAGGLTDGPWERGIPAGGGDRGDPPTDADGSGQCYVTDNADGNSDVDGGSTTLTSPVMDATVGTPIISYYRWYSNTEGSSPFQDIFVVEVSDDGGSSWVSLETVGPAGSEVGGGWFLKEFPIADFVELTDQFRIRFIASDTDPQSIVEAGVDAVQLTEIVCEPPATADITGPGDVPDGCVDAFDLGAMLGAWCSSMNDPNPPSPPCENCTPENLALADISGATNLPDGCVDAFDLAKLLAEWCSFLGGNPCATCF
ncbi:MAG: hypothetical protein O6933_08420, partial [Planctomycetota bacterium]|nr:hypothetical protein [Planctomycetota bacterium]